MITFSAKVKEEVGKIKLWDNNSTLKQDEQLTRLEIRQAFLESGSMSDPNKRYHLEIICKSNEKAQNLIKLLVDREINAKITTKGNGFSVYLKGGDDIVNFLALIGANSAVMEFEQIRVLKERRNTINRTVNCENANLDKTIKASVNQINAINNLINTGKINDLPVKLREIALLRIDNPDASLVELGKMLKEPIGKSGVNHRLQKIIEIAGVNY